ncbi:MAG: HAD family hydrolase [Spirochaetaceae bacterium]
MKTEKRGPGSTQKNSIGLALFDMDGLLFDTENLFLSMSEETQREMGYDIPLDIHLETIGRTFDEVRTIFLQQMGRNFPIQRFFDRTNKKIYKRIEEQGIPMKKGFHELLASLKQRGITSALASSSPLFYIRRYLQLADLENSFFVIVGGDEVEQGKPAPDIFLLAAERAEIDPKECVVFEDSNNGIRAAHAAGMRPVMVPDIKAPEEEVRTMVYRIYSDLSEAAADIDNILL